MSQAFARNGELLDVTSLARDAGVSRPTDRGPLWENLVLDELLTAVARSNLHYWRDAAGHEVDFVVVTGRDRVAAVEAKLSPQAFDAKSLRAFRDAYPHGPNLLCCPLVAGPEGPGLGRS